MNNLSKNIKFLRLQKKLTQEDIAKVVGKARSLISAWESDDRDITTEDIIKLSNFFNVSMDDLVGKDLQLSEQNKQFDELEILFDKNKEILTDEDKETIKFLIEKRKREIDKQMGNDQ